MQLSFQHLSKFLRGFTLIELLVVLAIVGILMGLLFPAVNGALNSARRASAQNDVVQIANAITMFQTEYGRWPTNTPDSPGNLSGALVSSLIGRNNDDNRRRITFLEAPDFKPKKGGLDGGDSGTYRDPWGNAYQVVADPDYGNNLSFSAGTKNAPGSTNFSLRKNVAAFNIGTSVADSSAPTFRRNVVYSWE